MYLSDIYSTKRRKRKERAMEFGQQVMIMKKKKKQNERDWLKLGTEENDVGKSTANDLTLR